MKLASTSQLFKNSINLQKQNFSINIYKSPELFWEWMDYKFMILLKSTNYYKLKPIETEPKESYRLTGNAIYCEFVTNFTEKLTRERDF
jgi:hypothetical protein